MEVIFKLDEPRIKWSQHLKDKVFIICSPKTLVIEPLDSTKIEAGIVLHLPKEAKAFIASKFRSQDIYEVNKQKSTLWIEILNTSYFEKLKRKIKTPLGFFVIEPEKLKSKYETKKKPKKQTGLPKNWDLVVENVLTEKKEPNRRIPKLVRLRVRWQRHSKSSYKNCPRNNQTSYRSN